MNKDDMVLISVDDHIVEPPDMFKNHLPKKYLDEAPGWCTSLVTRRRHWRRCTKAVTAAYRCEP